MVSYIFLKCLTRVSIKASEFLEKGETVRVKVLSVEEVKGRKRISLSMKAAQDDPWANISETVKEGQSFKGKVMSLESFGAFVEILPGIEGLIPCLRDELGKESTTRLIS